MEYGVSLWIVVAQPVAEGLARVREAAFTRVELVCGGETVGKWREDPEGFRRALEAAGLTACSVHTPQAGWDNDAPDETARLASIEAAFAVFGPAVRAGAELVIVHPNTNSHTFAPEDYEASVARSVASLRVLSERAADAGLRMAVENLPLRKEPRPAGRVEELLCMIDGLGPHVGICVDAGHANANGRCAADEVRAAGGKLFAVHIQDNDGLGEDVHILPGKGTTDWPAFFRALDEAPGDPLRTFEVPAQDGKVDETLAALATLRRTWEGTIPR